MRNMTAATELGMSHRRLAWIHGLILTVLAGSLYCIAADAEYWPFSQYPMYSTIVRPGAYSDLTLVASTATEPAREFSLTAEKYLIPFDWVRLREALVRLEAQPDHRAKLSEALRGCWQRYDMLRRAGRHHGPPLAAVRLYRQTWEDVAPWMPPGEASAAKTVLVAEVVHMPDGEHR